MAVAGELGEGDAVAGAAEAQDDAVMDEAFAVHPRADPGIAHLLAGVVLHQPGADAAFDVGAGLRLDHHAGDAGAGEDLAEQQPGGAGADDADLGAKRASGHGGLRQSRRGLRPRRGWSAACNAARRSRPEPP